MTKQLWIGVVLVLTLVVSGTAAADEGPATGRYQLTQQGATINVELHKNGTASMEGELFNWVQRAGQLVFTDASGTRVVAAYDGQSFSFSEGGVTLVFRRVGSAFTPAPATPASAGAVATTGHGYRASKLLKGKNYRVKGANASFTLPTGFAAREGEHEGQAGIIISSVRNPVGLVVIIPKLLNAQESQQRVSTLLQAAAGDLVGDTPVQTVVPPQDFRLKKHDAGFLELAGEQDGQRLRAKIGGIRIERWGAVFVAIYPEAQAGTYASVFDTIFTSFQAKPPKENRALAGQIAGCWEKVSSSGGGSGNAYSETRYRFGRDNSYSYQHMTSVSVSNGGGSSHKSEASGTFAAFGNDVTTTDSRTGESNSFSVRLQRGFLLLNGTRYTPCS